MAAFFGRYFNVLREDFKRIETQCMFAGFPVMWYLLAVRPQLSMTEEDKKNSVYGRRYVNKYYKMRQAELKAQHDHHEGGH